MSKSIQPLFSADPEMSTHFMLKPEQEGGYNVEQTRAAHDLVKPIIDANTGSVIELEINQGASIEDVFAVLHSCGIPIQALVHQEPSFRPTSRYSLQPEPTISPNAYSLIYNNE